MFVSVLSFRVRSGDADAVVALHEDWVRNLRSRTEGFVSGELLTGAGDAAEFVRIIRFKDEAAARRAEADPEYATWFRRLTSLAERQHLKAHFSLAWMCS